MQEQLVASRQDAQAAHEKLEAEASPVPPLHVTLTPLLASATLTLLSIRSWERRTIRWLTDPVHSL